MSLASLAHVVSSPGSLLPWRQVRGGVGRGIEVEGGGGCPSTPFPLDGTHHKKLPLFPSRMQAPAFSPTSLDSASCALACAAAGFFAFHLWVAIRYRLYAAAPSLPPPPPAAASAAPSGIPGSNRHRTIVHYTLLLLLFGIGAYKGVSLSLLSATLVGELAHVPFLVGKLQRIAGEGQLVPGNEGTERVGAAFFPPQYFILVRLPILLSMLLTVSPLPSPIPNPSLLNLLSSQACL